MKKLKSFLPIIIGAFIGCFVGRAVYTFVDFKLHPELYAANSAPWYTGLLPHGIMVAVVVLVCVIAEVIINAKLKRQN